MRMFSQARMPTYCALAALVVMAGAMSACRGRTRKSTAYASTVTAPAPNTVAQPA